MVTRFLCHLYLRFSTDADENQTCYFNLRSLRLASLYPIIYSNYTKHTLYFFKFLLCWDFIYVVAVSTAEGKVRDFINFYSRSHQVDLSLSRTLLLNQSETIRFNLN